MVARLCVGLRGQIIEPAVIFFDAPGTSCFIFVSRKRKRKTKKKEKRKNPFTSPCDAFSYSAGDAFKAALWMRAMIADHNACYPPAEHLPFDNVAIHVVRATLLLPHG